MDRLQAHREHLQASRKRLWHLALWLTLAGTAALCMAAPTPASAPQRDQATPGGTAAVEQRPLRGTYWKMMALRGAKVVVGEHAAEPHLNFSASELRVSGSSGCNRISGGFTHSDTALSLGPLISTRMACRMPALAQQEQQIFTQLEQVRCYSIQGDELSLLDASGQSVALLRSVMLR